MLKVCAATVLSFQSESQALAFTTWVCATVMVPPEAICVSAGVGSTPVVV
jgi:hypothetical protein